MTGYGLYKKVDYTMKEVEAIKKAAKAGKIQMKLWAYMEMMNLRTYCGADDNGSVEMEERFIKAAIKANEDEDMARLQSEIDAFQNHLWGTYDEDSCDYNGVWTRAKREQMASMDRLIKAKF